MNISTPHLAALFNDAIMDALTIDEVVEMKRLNREDYAEMGVCASHDFCDANHYLLASYEEMTGKNCDLTEEDFDIMNQAFDYAHKHFFK